MPGNFKKKDLRVIKTYASLLKALPELLQTRKFARLTINDLCEKAQLSRAAFYMHFQDKYDLLRYWLESLKQGMDNDAQKIYELINQFFFNNKKQIKNLLDDMDQITLSVIQDFIISILEIPHKNSVDENKKYKHTVLSIFCAGGVINFVLWNIKKDFPLNMPIINEHMLEILNMFSAIESTNKKEE